MACAEYPVAAQCGRQRYRVEIFSQFLHSKSQSLAARQQDRRVAAFQRITCQRRRGRRVPQQRAPACACANQHLTAIGLQVHEVAGLPWQQCGEMRPACGSGDRVVGDDEDAGKLDHGIGVAQVLRPPDGIRGVVLDKLDSPFRHFVY